MIPEPIQQLQQEFHGAQLDEPYDNSNDALGLWWLVIPARQRSFEVSWSKIRGFELFLNETPIYGDNDHEHFEDVSDLIVRINQL